MVATATGVVVCQLHFTGLSTLLVSCDSAIVLFSIVLLLLLLHLHLHLHLRLLLFLLLLLLLLVDYTTNTHLRSSASKSQPPLSSASSTLVD